MTPLQQALHIIGMEPLPDDAYQQLVKLESLTTEDDRTRFAWIWEGYIVAGGTFPDEKTP